MFHIDISSDHASLRGPLVMVSRGNTSHSPLEYATPEHASGSAEMLTVRCCPWPPVGCGEEFQTWRNAPRPCNCYWPAESRRANCPGLISMVGGVRS